MLSNYSNKLNESVKRVPAIFPVGHAVAAKNPDIPFAVVVINVV